MGVVSCPVTLSCTSICCVGSAFCGCCFALAVCVIFPGLRETVESGVSGVTSFVELRVRYVCGVTLFYGPFGTSRTS